MKQTAVSDAEFIALMMEAVRNSVTSVYFETTQRYIPEGYRLQREYSLTFFIVIPLNFYF
jgi:hypothetical protein